MGILCVTARLDNHEVNGRRPFCCRAHPRHWRQIPDLSITKFTKVQGFVWKEDGGLANTAFFQTQVIPCQWFFLHHMTRNWPAFGTLSELHPVSLLPFFPSLLSFFVCKECAARGEQSLAWAPTGSEASDASDA